MRFASEQPGIRSGHAFSAGVHYDPDHVSFGPVVGLDEHALDAGAGFDWHAHRGVVIVSRVLAGTLRHEDSQGVVREVGAGEFLVQSAGDGIRHAETNASRVEPLRFVQLTVLADLPVGVRCPAPPFEVGGATVTVASRYAGAGPVLIHDAARGEALCLPAGEREELAGDLLVVTLTVR